MPDDYLETSGELNDTLRPKGKKKTSPWIVVLRVFLILIFVVSLSVSSILIYVNVKYPDPCWVSGMSMYPTLNSDSSIYVTSEGSSHYSSVMETSSGLYSSLFYEHGNKDLVDYGYTDGKSETIDSLSRFNILVTYYPLDYKSDGSGLVTDSSGNITAVPKIKRLVGLPGETVVLSYPSDDTPVSETEPMGSLYIWSSNETAPATIDEFKALDDVAKNAHFVEQPLKIADYNAPFKNLEGYENVTYPASGMTYSANPNSSTDKKNQLWTCGEGEYVVLGDNRAGNCSSDSRQVGKIKKSYIISKVVMMVGRCKISTGSDGKKSCHPNDFKWPWNIQKL